MNIVRVCPLCRIDDLEVGDKQCKQCGSSGTVLLAHHLTCPTCDGTGCVDGGPDPSVGWGGAEEECPDCEGVGFIGDAVITCRYCGRVGAAAYEGSDRCEECWAEDCRQAERDALAEWRRR